VIECFRMQPPIDDIGCSDVHTTSFLRYVF